MYTYQLTLDSQLVSKVEHTLKGVPLQAWLQQQVEALLLEQANPTPRRAHRKRRHGNALSDEQLAEALKDNAPLTPEDFPNLSEADYAAMVRSRSGKLSKGLEKWL